MWFSRVMSNLLEGGFDEGFVGYGAGQWVEFGRGIGA